jgi:hypothetical protein
MSLSCSELIFKISCHVSRRQCAPPYFSFALSCTKSDYLHTSNVYQLSKNSVTFVQVIRNTRHEIWSLLVCITLNKIRLLFLQVICSSLQKVLPLSYNGACLRHCATSRKVPGSIPGVAGFLFRGI